MKDTTSTKHGGASWISKGFGRAMILALLVCIAGPEWIGLYGCGRGRKVQDPREMMMHVSLLFVRERMFDERETLGHFPEFIPDDLSSIAAIGQDPDAMALFLGNTTGASVPGGLAPPNVFSSTTFAIYAVPAFDPTRLLMVIPEGLFYLDEYDQWKLLDATPPLVLLRKTPVNGG